MRLYARSKRNGIGEIVADRLVVRARVRVPRGRVALEALRIRAQRRDSTPQEGVDLAVEERGRQLEAGRALVVARLARLQRVLRVLALAAGAVEALDRPELNAAHQRVRVEIRLAARPVRRLRSVLVRLERAVLDDAHLGLASLAGAVVGREVGPAVRD